MYAITMKRGILLAAFGSGSSQGESTLRRFDAQVRKAFPDVSVRWAFTSMLMRERLASERKRSDSVHKALKKMAFEKFTHVAVQPVHVIPGLEYGDIVSDADELRADGTFASLVVGAPLLTESQASVDRAARALLAELPSGRAPGEPVLFMGHGSRHAAESRYEALAAAVRERDPLVLMGTLNGTIRLEHIVEHLGVRSIVSGCCPCSPSWGGIRLKTWLGIRNIRGAPGSRPRASPVFPFFGG